MPDMVNVGLGVRAFGQGNFCSVPLKLFPVTSRYPIIVIKIPNF
jgi:hypothetical protein